MATRRRIGAMRRISEAERDARDLKALDLLAGGMNQKEVAARLGITRGPLVRMLREIRDDMQASGEVPAKGSGVSG